MIASDYDQVLASQQIMVMLQSVLAEAICKNVGREEIHDNGGRYFMTLLPAEVKGV